MSTLIDRIKKHEGFRNCAYKDSEGYLTIGYGRLIDQKLGGGITVEEADMMLRHDVMLAQDAASQFTWYRKLDEDRQGVVVEMIFNLGLPRFLGFKKMIQSLRDDDYDEAKIQMMDSLWARQVGKRADMLAKIMGAEKIMKNYRGA